MIRPSWEHELPAVRGPLPLGGILRRTDPAGAYPAPIAIVGLYPALTKMALYTCANGDKINLPVEVERRSFDGSESASELEQRYIKPLGLSPEVVFKIDLYPYFLANTVVGKNGRSMWSNAERFHLEACAKTAVQGRPEDNEMVHMCRTLPGNRARLAHYFRRCNPALVVTLGNEVAAYVRGYEAARTARAQLYGPPINSDAFGVPLTIVHGAHPGSFMRLRSTDSLVSEHTDWCTNAGRALVENALRTWTPGSPPSEAG